MWSGENITMKLPLIIYYKLGNVIDHYPTKYLSLSTSVLVLALTLDKYNGFQEIWNDFDYFRVILGSCEAIYHWRGIFFMYIASLETSFMVVEGCKVVLGH